MRYHPNGLRRALAWYLWRCSLKLESMLHEGVSKVFFVGRDDLLYYKLCGGTNGYFLRHPLSEELLEE